ncbi:MAG: dTDP-4-dehydrorhamnose 3,5-epimerase, partial [Oscillatoria sp. PMC 1068.18]|nr:dTDP-4-dehydrorhamnose 3,5-epimerase [Oscillatoria sp. PMC 1068.18]
LLGVRGSFILGILQNRQYRYIYLIENLPQVVKIPPGVPHSAINLNPENCFLVNAVLRHGNPHPKDYQAIAPPFPYNLVLAEKLFATQENATIAQPACSSQQLS